MVQRTREMLNTMFASVDAKKLVLKQVLAAVHDAEQSYIPEKDVSAVRACIEPLRVNMMQSGWSGRGVDGLSLDR